MLPPDTLKRATLSAAGTSVPLESLFKRRRGTEGVKTRAATAPQ